MFAYYRTSCHSTVIQKLLRGSISSSDASDLVLVKGNSLEWMTIGSVAESDPNLLSSQLQQSTFGTINDAQLLRCEFQEGEDDAVTIPVDEVYEEISYSKIIRNHSYIEGHDILVMLSEYGKLVFSTLYFDHVSKAKRFETLTEVYLDKPGLEYTKIGKKLAIDPYSRAIAIGSFQDSFDILILNKTMSRRRFDPIFCRGSEFEEGIIWHMEFLHTETRLMDRILLAMVIYNDVERLCRLVVFAINASDLANITIEKLGRLPLERSTPLPLLLIPLKFQHEAFLLVTEQQVCLLTADDLASGNVLYHTNPIPRRFGSTECPLFTSFASHLDPSTNYIYLGSAEGYLYRLYISAGRTYWVEIEQTNPISHTMCMLGTIDMIDQDNHHAKTKADVILYAGESCDSRVLAIPCRQQTTQKMVKHTLLQGLVNRAPLTDFQVAENFREHQDALITCSGQFKDGSLSIITHGIEATALHSSKAEWKGITRMWSLTVSSANLHEEIPCLLVSSLIDTRLFSAKDGHLKDITSSSSIEFETETVHANTINIKDHKLILQVTPKGVLITNIGQHASASILTRWRPDIDVDYQIELATSWNDRGNIFIAACVMTEDLCFIYILNVTDISQDNSTFSLSTQDVSTLKLHACPSYIGQFEIRSRSLLVVGTYSPSLHFYSITDGNLQIVQELDISYFSPGQFAVPYSTSIISSVSDEPLYFLVGLIQGSILSFKLDKDDNSGVILDQRPDLHNIGTRAVRLSPLYQSKKAVYALSDQLWRMTCSDSDQVETEHILLPKFNNSIDAFAPFDCNLPLLHTTGEPLAVVADGKLRIFQIGLKSQTNTHKISLGETPRKVIYDKSLNYIIVITSTTECGERKNYVRLIDPSSGQPLAESQLLWTDTDYGKTDIVLSTAEWSVENNGKLYKYLCIGIGHSRESFHSFRSGLSAKKSEASMSRGTLLLFRLKAKVSKSSSYSMTRVWTQEKLPGGVFAIRPHPAGLLFSAGSHLYLYRLVNGRLVEVAHEPLRFTITSIHEDGDRICVTSHTDSLSFYQFDPDSCTLEFLKSDVVSRSIHHSLMLNDRLAVGASQSGGMVALYDDPNDKSFESRLRCLFSFHYPDIIIKPSLALLRSQLNTDVDTNLLTQHLLPWYREVNADHHSNNSSTVTVKPIVGCTVSGGVMHVYRISPALYTLLDALQNILVEYEPTSPLLGSAKDFKSWYCQLSGGEKSSVHGDLVEAFLRLTEEEQIFAIQNEQGFIKPELLEAIKLFSPTYLMETELDDGKNHVSFIAGIISGFEKYR